uniref:Uncharacterized protein n=1 Tax=Ditylenchus dipsaci TaxID=166011 RepID=A0A915E178_9BILA
MAGDSVDYTNDFSIEDELTAVQALLSLSRYFFAAAGKIVGAARVVPDCSMSAAAISDDVANHDAKKAGDAGGKRAGSDDSRVVTKKFKNAEDKQ